MIILINMPPPPKIKQRTIIMKEQKTQGKDFDESTKKVLLEPYPYRGESTERKTPGQLLRHHDPNCLLNLTKFQEGILHLVAQEYADQESEIARQEGYKKGYSNGYDIGYKNGHEEGYERGSKHGHGLGVEDGVRIARQEERERHIYLVEMAWDVHNNPNDYERGHWEENRSALIKAGYLKGKEYPNV